MQNARLSAVVPTDTIEVVKSIKPRVEALDVQIALLGC